MPSTVETIWEEFASKLRSFIRSRVRDHGAAEDILQEVFLKIHKKLPSLRESERLEAWVWRIARNAVTDYFRSPSRETVLPEDLSHEGKSEVPDLSPCVRRFVEELPKEQKEALLLTEWQGLKQDEMAKKLGLSHSGAKSRVQRARANLKELLLDCCRLELDRRGNVIEMTQRRKRCDSAC